VQAARAKTFGHQRLSTSLKATAAVRLSSTDFTVTQTAIGPVAGRTPINFTGGQSEKPVTPKVGLSYQIDSNNMLYTSAAKGYRIGGANAPIPVLCNPYLAQIGLSGPPDTYRSDSVWSYEVGSKNRLFGGALSIDASAFEIRWNNIQRAIRIAQCGSGFTTNLGSAKSDGFDLAISLRPTDHLTLGATAGYADARLTASAPAVGGAFYALDGDKIGGAPWGYTFSGQYTFSVAGRDSYVRTDFQHIGAGPRPDIDPRVIGVDATIPGSQSFDNVSLRGGIRTSGVDVSLFVDNLLDKAPVLSKSRDNTASPLYFLITPRPRTIGVTATYRY
jgi:outer membrane receptor protein involved in Fe transport